MHWTLIRAIRKAEEEKRDRSLGPALEIKRSTGGIGEDKPWFWQGWCDQSAPIVVAFPMLRRQQTRENQRRRQSIEISYRLLSVDIRQCTHLSVNNDCPFHAELVMNRTDVVERARRGEGHKKPCDIGRRLGESGPVLWRRRQETRVHVVRC